VPKKSDRGLATEIMAIGKRCAALPDIEPRTAEEILGYDENGLPS
jgi:antitoxin VapB